MSFYSALVLAANHEVTPPTPGQVAAVLAELRLIKPNPYGFDHDNLADDVSDLFNDPEACAENRRFFAPDSISFDDHIEVEGPDCAYAGAGWAVRIHGNGYLFPWEISDVRSRVLTNEKLKALRATLNRDFGGTFRLPSGVPELRDRVIDGEDGWTWLLHESL